MNYDIHIDKNKCSIYFEHKLYGEESCGSIIFDRNNQADDIDGCSGIPLEVAKYINNNTEYNINISHFCILNPNNWYDKDFNIITKPIGYGFVYKITYIDGTQYIGKKNFFIKKILLKLKSGKRRDNHIKFNRNKEVIKQESNWRDYIGSSKVTPLQDKINYKQILEIAYTKQKLSYLEEKYLFSNNVLEDDNFHNEAITKRYTKAILIRDNYEAESYRKQI